MKRTLVGALLIHAAATLALSQTKPKPPPTIKADSGESSQQAAQNIIPQGWSAAGSHPQDYDFGTDTEQKHTGRAGAYVKLQRFKYKSEGFGALTQMFKADGYKSKRVRLSAYVRTENIEEYAGLWMRVDGDGRMLGFDNMHNRPIIGTTEWQKYEVILDVPEASINIAIGLLLRGPGQAWVDDFQLEAVGSDVAATNRLPPQGIKDKGGAPRNSPTGPVNLGFEN